MEKKKETTVSVHRCRFVDYAPSAITALAFPPLPLPSVKGKKKASTGQRPSNFGLLAVGHANGNIELCEWTSSDRDPQCPQAWVVRKTLSGPYPSKVDCLTFVIRYPDDLDPDDVPQLPQLRLFSSGGGSELVEWDLERGCIRRTISSQGGSIWSLAVNPACTSIALGCEDGTVRIISVVNDTLTHLRRFDRVKCRVLSIAWGPPTPRKPTQKPTDDSSDEEDEEEWLDSWLVTGGSDSSLRKWDATTGNAMDRMGVDKIRGERTLVWSVGVLGDGTIVSGDSLGSVKFWDSRTCTQLYSFQAHGADVLCMTISPDGKHIYTSGVDQKTVQFSLVKTSSASTSSSPTSRWTQTTSKRMHSHDVRSLAIWPPYQALPSAFKRTYPPTLTPILASGGLDMSVVLTPAATPSNTLVKTINPLDTSTETTFEDSYHRKLSYVGKGKVKVARGARLVSCIREAGLTVWKIVEKKNIDEDLAVEDELNRLEMLEEGLAWEKVLEMDLKVHSNIVAHEISDDGKWLVVSDLYESKLFSIQTSDSGQVAIKRVKELSNILQIQIPRNRGHPHSTGGSAFHFTPDSSKLILATSLSSYILVIDLTSDTPRVLRRFDHHRCQDTVVRNRVVMGRLAASKRSVDTSEIKSLVNGDVEMAEVAMNGVTGSESESEHEKDSGMDENDEDDSSSDEEVSSSPLVVGVDLLEISADGQWLASTDNRGRTHIFNLDSISHHTVLPSFPHPIQALTFDPMHPSVLLLAFSNNTIQVYDVESRHFPAWGKDLSNCLPKRLTLNHEVVLGAVFKPHGGDYEDGVSSAPPAGGNEKVQSGKDNQKLGHLLLWGSTWIFKVSLDPKKRHITGKKRRRPGEDSIGDANNQWWDYKMISQYRPILCCDFLSKDELVVVERPLVDILLTLPPAYFKPKYGAS